MRLSGPSRSLLIAALVASAVTAAAREAAVRPINSRSTFKGVRPPPTPDQTFRGA